MVWVRISHDVRPKKSPAGMKPIGHPYY